jgi:hypothetical protein
MPATTDETDENRPGPHYFHGTRGTWKRGDRVIPRKVSGEPPSRARLTPGAQPREASENYVYVTLNWNLAWAYAHKAGRPGEPVLLVVHPEGELSPDPESSDAMKAYCCAAAMVLAVDDQPPFSAEDAEKGWKLPISDASEKVDTFVVKRVAES